VPVEAKASCSALLCHPVLNELAEMISASQTATVSRLPQLPLSLDRLPLPSLLLLTDKPQVGEGREMMGEDQGVLLCRQVEDPVFAGEGLLGKHVEDRGPFRMLQVKRVEHRVGDVQQLLTFRGDGQRDVSWCVSEGGNSANTGHDLGGVLDEERWMDTRDAASERTEFRALTRRAGPPLTPPGLSALV
jgi:hypothetical protein